MECVDYPGTWSCSFFVQVRESKPRCGGWRCESKPRFVSWVEVREVVQGWVKWSGRALVTEIQCFQISSILKKFMLGETQVRAIYRHCKEEMFVLGRLISRLGHMNLLF